MFQPVHPPVSCRDVDFCAGIGYLSRALPQQLQNREIQHAFTFKSPTARGRNSSYRQKRGEIPKSKLRSAAKQMEKFMTEKELVKFASNKLEGLPDRKS